MITAGGFFIGLIFATLGFLAVWKSYWFRRTIGDVNEIFGAPGVAWLTWNTVGIFLLVLGLFIMFGLFQSIAIVFLKPFSGQGL